MKTKKSIFAIIQDIKTKKVLTAGTTDDSLLKQMQSESKIYLHNGCFEDLYIPESFHKIQDKSVILIKVRTNKESKKYSLSTDFSEENKDDYAYLHTLQKKIQRSIDGEKRNTHVSSVVKKGAPKIAQKFGEEAVELVIEAAKENDELFKDEAADVFYYYLIMLQERGFTFSDILKQLKLQRRKI